MDKQISKAQEAHLASAYARRASKGAGTVSINGKSFKVVAQYGVSKAFQYNFGTKGIYVVERGRGRYELVEQEWGWEIHPTVGTKIAVEVTW
jgi:hypothetical protein